MSEVERLCSSVLMMNNGSIIDQGSTERINSKTWKKKYGRSFLKLTRKNYEF